MMLTKEYYAIHEALERWHINVDDLSYLIENKVVVLCAKVLNELVFYYQQREANGIPYGYPCGQERASGTFPLFAEESREILHYKALLVRRFKSEKEGTNYIEPYRPLMLEWRDIGVSVLDQKRLDDLLLPPSAPIPNIMIKRTDDGRVCVQRHGKSYLFSEKQGQVILNLKKAALSGDPWVHGKVLLRDVSKSNRMTDFFKRTDHWRDVIEGTYQGYYRLK